MSLKVTYIGHATVLIEFNGVTLLTDPVFSSRILFFKRLKPLTYDPARLPKLDAVLLSHAHYDHLDLFSYKYIPGDVPIIIPEGMSKAIAPFVNNPVVELSTWSRFSLKKDCEICAIPSRHPGGRLIIPYRYRTCHGYVVTVGGENIYLSGDTAYQDDFKNLSRLFPLKLAVLSLACDWNDRFFRSRHMNLEDCLRCWEDLGRPDWIPIHWGSFFKYLRGPGDGITALQKKAEINPELKAKLHFVPHGESFELMT